MPICDKPPLQLGKAKSATEIDDHASEAAKMKRTREQAYFNSYNFDAIQMLPYDNDNALREQEEEVQNVGSQSRPPAAALNTNSVTTKVPASNSGNQNQPPQHNTLKTMLQRSGGGGGASSFASSQSNRSHGSLHSSSGRGSQRSGNSSDVDGYLRRQHSGELTYPCEYMQQRFGALLVHSRNASPSSDLERDSIQEGGKVGRVAGGGVSASDELASVHGRCASEVSENGGFLLPRAMLKYQSVGNANSMPLAVNNAGRTDKLLQNGHNQQLCGNNNNSSSSSDANGSNNCGSSGKTMMMTTNVISNKHTQHKNNNIHSISCKKSSAIPSAANTKAINSSSSNNNNSSSTTNKKRLSYAKSNDGYASLLVASDVNSRGAPYSVATKTAASAATIQATVAQETNSAPGAAVRVKKQSTSSTITTTTTASSSVSAEHAATAVTSAVGTVATLAARVNNGKVTTSSKTSDSKLAQSGGSERRGRTSSHQSHYSTDKSGSSGYYSSNVCSTYSLDEHIYCEPVIDILDVSGTGAGSATGKSGKSARLECSNQATLSGDNSKGKPVPTGTTTLAASDVRDMGSKGGATKRCLGRRNGVAVATISRNGESHSSVLDGEDECDGDAEDEAAAAARHSGNVAQNSKALADTAHGVSKVPASLQFLLQRQTSEEYSSQSQHFSDNLRILETSIENLDRHLKNFPSLSSHERIAAFVQTQHHHHHHHAYLQMPPAEVGDKLAIRIPQHPHQYLPTIMEGYDPANNQPRRSWPDDMVDDSLLDIDLDSFLLVNERKTGAKLHKPSLPVGIDNPTFLTDEQEEENNYKCEKYINSCPDDAYRVESDIVAGTGTVSEKSLSVADHCMKRYEDQLHFQSTRELLEDVRDKIRLLSQVSRNASKSGSAGSHSPEVQQHFSRDTSTEQLPRELEEMIKMLKSELENYLDRMNQHSELEIRQLCSGLVRNHNIVKMTKAFERRRSTHSLGAVDSDYGYSGNYEAICDGVPASIREQIASIRCASDPNFKMKRKSLTEVFPVTDCYAESDALQRVPSQIAQQQRRPSLSRRDRADQRQREHDQNVISLHVSTTQLQRNLSFQQPVLSKLDAKTLAAASANAEIGVKGNTNGSSSAGGSGAESGESGDKDSILEWHRKKPSIWEMYYGTNRMNQSLLGKRSAMVTNNNNQVTMSYPSSRPESDFTLDLPRAEQLRIKMEKEKKFRQRCRYITTFLSLVFFLLTVMVVSLVLTRGKRMFGSMI